MQRLPRRALQATVAVAHSVMRSFDSRRSNNNSVHGEARPSNNAENMAQSVLSAPVAGRTSCPSCLVRGTSSFADAPCHGIPLVASAISSAIRQHWPSILAFAFAAGTHISLMRIWPHWTTVHAILSFAAGLATWTCLQWLCIAYHLVHECARNRSNRSTGQSLAGLEQNMPLLSATDETKNAVSTQARHVYEKLLPSTWSRIHRLAVFAASTFSIAVIMTGAPGEEQNLSLPRIIPSNPGVPEKYFIAANLYNNEKVLPVWSSELLSLCLHRMSPQVSSSTEHWPIHN